MQDGAVVDKKEPLERSGALEDPEVAAEILVENPEAEKFEESVSNRLSRLSKIEESSIKSTVEGAGEAIETEETFAELIVEAVLENAEEIDEVIETEKTFVELIIEAVLENAKEVVEALLENAEKVVEAVLEDAEEIVELSAEAVL